MSSLQHALITAIVGASGQPTNKITNRPRTIGVQFNKRFQYAAPCGVTLRGCSGIPSFFGRRGED